MTASCLSTFPGKWNQTSCKQIKTVHYSPSNWHVAIVESIVRVNAAISHRLIHVEALWPLCSSQTLHYHLIQYAVMTGKWNTCADVDWQVMAACFFTDLTWLLEWIGKKCSSNVSSLLWHEAFIPTQDGDTEDISDTLTITNTFSLPNLLNTVTWSVVLYVSH